MAKQQGKDATRLKAEALKKQQASKEKRTRAIIFAVVGVLLAFTLIAVIWVISNSDKGGGASGSDEVRPMYVSSEGVGKTNDGVKTVQEYFDYSCHACADIDTLLGKDLTDSAQKGEFNLELIPVNVVEMPWHPVATTAAYAVYDNEPDKFVQFHHALTQFFSSSFNAGDGSIIQDQDKSLAQVKTIASEIGISDDTIKKFEDVDTSQLATNTEAWKNAKVEGREGLGTPEFVLDGKKLTLSGNTLEEARDNLLKEIKGE